MKYCDKFYELTEPMYVRMLASGREVLLCGENESPFGTVPKYLYYTGEWDHSYAKSMLHINQMLYSCWSPPDEVGCDVTVDVEYATDGIRWERKIKAEETT